MSQSMKRIQPAGETGGRRNDRRRSRLRAGAGAVAVVLIVSHLAWAQLQLPAPPTPGDVGTAAQQLAAAPPPVTVNTAEPCCPPPSIWDFLGVKQIAQAVGKIVGFVGGMPIVQGLNQAVLTPAAAAAGLKPSPAGAGFTPPPGAAPTPAGPASGVAPPGVGPPGPDGLPGPPPPPSAAEAAALIDADQAQAPAKIAAIRYLAQQDCACYPEVTAALLGELDNCVEEVRYEALKALRGSCLQPICDPTRIPEHKRVRLFGKRPEQEIYACGPECARCACQVQAIERLSDLLLERDVTGARKERSPRVRRLAILIIQECLGQMPPQPGVLTPEPDPFPVPRPDPVPGPVPPPPGPTAQRPRDAVNRSTETAQKPAAARIPPSALSRMQTEQLRQALAAAALENVGTPVSVSAGEQQAIVQIEWAADPDGPEAILNEIARLRERSRNSVASNHRPERDQRPMPDGAMAPSYGALAGWRAGDVSPPMEAGASAETPRLHNAAAAEDEIAASELDIAAIERRIVELATEAIVQTHGDAEREPQFNRAVHHLLEARLRLALTGEEKDVDALHSDADALYRRSPQSQAAAEAVFALVRYSRLAAEEHTDDRQAGREFAGQARNFAVNFPHDANRAASQLFAAGWHCGRQGQTDEAVSCYQLLLQSFPDSDFAEHAQTALIQRTAPHDPIQLAGAISKHEARLAAGHQPPAMPLPPDEDYYPLPEMDPLELADVPPMTYLPGETFERALHAVNADLFLAANSLINIGTERAAISTFEMDWAQPSNVFRIRFDTGFDYFRPDRNEFFWARIGGNGPPLPETSVNFNELRLYSETGTDTASAIFELPLRNVDPDVNSGSTGLGDLVIGAKSVIVRGEDYTVSSIFRTYLPTGSSRRGIGRGHTALEPGVLATFRPACNTYVHGELKFHFPLGGDRDHSGVVSRYGLGVSHVLLAEPLHSGPGDQYALISSFEVVTWSFHGGMETRPDGTVRSASGIAVVNAQPGIRLMFGERFEIGVGGAIPLSRNRMHDGLVRTELRWVY